MRTLVPMIRVPDVAATAAWYASIGFTVNRTFAGGEETTSAWVSFGDRSFMLNAGGRPWWRRRTTPSTACAS
jgi:predicted lactoylglutathione lyase